MEQAPVWHRWLESSGTIQDAPRTLSGMPFDGAPNLQNYGSLYIADGLTAMAAPGQGAGRNKAARVYLDADKLLSHLKSIAPLHRFRLKAG